MLKAIVYKSGQTGQWAIRLGDNVLEPRVLLGYTPTHAEALFLAQLLADPHEYIRAAQERALDASRSTSKSPALLVHIEMRTND